MYCGWLWGWKMGLEFTLERVDCFSWAGGHLTSLLLAIAFMKRRQKKVLRLLYDSFRRLFLFFFLTWKSSHFNNIYMMALLQIILYYLISIIFFNYNNCHLSIRIYLQLYRFELNEYKLFVFSIYSLELFSLFDQMWRS